MQNPVELVSASEKIINLPYDPGNPGLKEIQRIRSEMTIKQSIPQESLILNKQLQQLMSLDFFENSFADSVIKDGVITQESQIAKNNQIKFQVAIEFVDGLFNKGLITEKNRDDVYAELDWNLGYSKLSKKEYKSRLEALHEIKKI